MSRAVMQQLLEALQNCANGEDDVLLTREALSAGRQELAKPEPEPFGYFKAEPFGWVDCAETDDGAKALYEALPQRQPLTDARIDELWCEYPSDEFGFARAIEAAHEIKEKIE